MSVLWEIETFDELSSTQDYIKARDNLSHGLAIQAKKQTAGYGRHGRIWVSLPGNLFLSFALIPRSIDPEKTGLLALGIGSALAQTVKSHIQNTANTVVKWPNDVLIDGRKCAGLLLETHNGAIIVGVGINITNAPQAEIATCLTDHGCTSSRETLLHDFLTHVSDIYTRWGNQEYAYIRDTFLKSGFPQNTPMSVKTPQMIYQGMFHDIDQNGALLLRDQDGNVLTLTSGQIFVTD